MSDVTSGYRRTAIYSGSVDVLAEENFSKAEALLNGIPGGVYKAVGSALTRAASAGKTEAKRAVAQEYTIGSGDFLRYTRNINHFVRGGDGSVEVVFGFAGYPIPLMHFQMSIDGEGRPVAHVKRSNAPEVLRHAFRANAGSHWGIYERVGAERFPIRQLYGPATTQMMYSNENVLDTIEEKMAETYEKRIDHEILRVLNGWGV
ncbi:MAG: hypothetical protein K2P33_02210 [Acutalibacter sp.]|nr:hypothetical protein [Acutalibacter sp.]